MKKEELVRFLDAWENMTLLFSDKGQAALHFQPLMEIALHGNDKVTWRASWAVNKINDMIPGIASGWIDRLVDALPQTLHHGKKREFLKMISLYPLPEGREGFLLDYCLDKMTSPKENVSTRVYCMQILYNISERETGLKEELLQIIDQEMEYHPSPGIKARGKRLVSRLKKEISKKHVD